MCSRILGLWLFLAHAPVWANVPGGGTNGPNVALKDNGPSVTISNGMVSILCSKTTAIISNISYTYNNGGGSKTVNLLGNGYAGGKLYWYTGNFGSGAYTYSIAASNTNYIEIDLLSASSSNGVMDIHFSVLRGSPGFYVTAIMSHRASDAAMGIGLAEDNIYAGSIFNWMSVDAARSRLMEVSGGASIGVYNAPPEVYSVDEWHLCRPVRGQIQIQRRLWRAPGAWGWSSVGSGGNNVGLWNVSASAEYYNGGPMRRELMSHIGTTILNVLNCTHYGNGNQDAALTNSELWAQGLWALFYLLQQRHQHPHRHQRGGAGPV